MKKKFAQIIACGLIAGIVGGGLVALYEWKSRTSIIWPFPRTARVLPGCVEVVAWVVFICVFLFAVWLLFATLFELAGWYTPYDLRTDEKCYRCSGTGRVRR